MIDNVRLEEWVEPQIDSLNVEETYFNPGVGRDGGVADCSRS